MPAFQANGLFCAEIWKSVWQHVFEICSVSYGLYLILSVKRNDSCTTKSELSDCVQLKCGIVTGHKHGRGASACHGLALCANPAIKSTCLSANLAICLQQLSEICLS